MLNFLCDFKPFFSILSSIQSNLNFSSCICSKDISFGGTGISCLFGSSTGVNEKPSFLFKLIGSSFKDISFKLLESPKKSLLIDILLSRTSVLLNPSGSLKLFKSPKLSVLVSSEFIILLSSFFDEISSTLILFTLSFKILLKFKGSSFFFSSLVNLFLLTSKSKPILAFLSATLH